jgi:hypothetical protein
MIKKLFFTDLGFYETSPEPLYKLPLPTVGTYLIASAYGYLWLEVYDEDNGDHYRQSVGFGLFNEEQITELVALLTSCR